MFSLKKNILCIAFILLLTHVVAAQISITSPLLRAVYQRGKDGQATVSITGTYTAAIDKIEIKLSQVIANQGTPIDWTELPAKLINGNFISSFTIKQGWYKLELRGSLKGVIVGQTSLERVGVGEVFVIAGQSNAEGLLNKGEQGAVDDRVNCYNAENNYVSGGIDYVKLNPFAKLERNVKIAPRGQGASHWGKLGDLLTARLNVPIMFFNVGFFGTSVRNWQESAETGITTSDYVSSAVYLNGTPYSNMRDVLHYYSNLLGIRAILWLQGETDNIPAATPRAVYSSRLKKVIQKTRDDYGKEISWVVSLTSVTTGNGLETCFNTFKASNQEVLEGQKAVIRETANIFQGPNTDNIQNPGRPDCTHFANQGLIDLANAWDTALNDNFWANSKPHAPALVPDYFVTCDVPNNAAKIELPQGYKTYGWSRSNNFTSFASTPTINLSSGTYYARLEDNNGNFLMLPPITVKAAAVGTPSINVEGATTFCEGKQVKLTSNQSPTFLNYQWSDGTDSPSITVDKTGQYSVKITDIYGCQSQSSTTISTKRNPLPGKPSINNLSSRVFCEDNSVTLEVDQVADKYVWSNGSNNRSIKVNTTSEYNVQVIDANGCLSQKSDNLNVTALPLPPTPTITADSPTIFCEDKGVTLTTSDEKATRVSWNKGQTARSIFVNKSDTLFVRTVDLFGCVSKPSLTVITKMNPTPVTPKITANGDTVFCEGRNITLFSNKANPSHVTTWTINQEGITKDYRTEQFGVNISGSFQVIATDQNGCVSKQSDKVFVSVKPNPDELNLVRLSPYTLQAQNQKTTAPAPNEYYWEFGQDNVPLKSKTQFQRIDQEGLYRVRARNIYQTRFYSEKLCESKSTPQQRIIKYDDAGLSLFPNPNTGKFQIESAYPWEGTTVRVYDLLGRMLFEESVGTMNNRKQLNLDLRQGEYIFEMQSANNFKFQKRLMIVR
jgi:hypothetical protein